MLDAFILFAQSPFGAAFAFLYGTVIGSFVTLLVYRLPRGLPWTWTRSKCTACDKTLGVSELVPLFSYVFQMGKCKCGKTRIAARYPLIEFTLGLGGLALWAWLT